MNILIVNYNTQDITENCITSINRYCENPNIYVWDNSDRLKFVNRFKNVTVLDNTAGQHIDFESWLDSFPYKHKYTNNNYGSAKHCVSVQKFIDILRIPFILLDSDTVVKRDLSPLWDERYLFTGEIDNSTNHHINIPRLLPYCCFINVPVCISKGITYFNSEYMWKLTRKNPDRFYDTGAWFLLSCIKAEPTLFKTIHYTDYIDHLVGGSWK